MNIISGLPHGTEIKIPGVGVTPVAVSTQLPAAVAQLNQQGNIQFQFDTETKNSIIILWFGILFEIIILYQKETDVNCTVDNKQSYVFLCKI